MQKQGYIGLKYKSTSATVAYTVYINLGILCWYLRFSLILRITLYNSTKLCTRVGNWY
jgi:hypothetical protein